MIKNALLVNIGHKLFYSTYSLGIVGDKKMKKANINKEIDKVLGYTLD